MIVPKGAVRRVRVRRHGDTGLRADKDAVAVEEPLEIRLSWVVPGGTRASEPVAVTMRTPGHDFELVAGFLHGEGIVRTPDALQELTYCQGGAAQEFNVVEARLREGVPFDAELVRRNFYTSSSCGVCGKASLESVEVRGCPTMTDDGFAISAELLCRLPDALYEKQSAFHRTGGLHAAGLLDRMGTPTCVREDVGRHNAVDKVLGWAFLDRALPAKDRVLVVSGRASFEIVQKAAMAGVPVLVAVGAPSSLAIDLAERFGQTLVGFVRGGGFNVYTGPGRVG